MRVRWPTIAMDRRPWPAALALLSLSFVGSFLLYTELMVREVRAEAAVHSRMYAIVQRGLLSLEPGAELKALASLQTTLTELGVPVVVRGADGEVQAVANLPFEADLTVASDRERVEAFARELDRRNPAIVEPGVGTVHFGSPPVLHWLRWVPLLQVGTAIALLLVALGLVRSSVRAERERLWAAMARELAHQMGTPLSSLVGWVEVLGLPPEERAGLVDGERIAREIGADVERLERVARRFELIGKAPTLDTVRVEEVLDELERYLRPRVPQLGGAIRFRVRAARGLPSVRANRVLLVWALENVVRNALDALAGRTGSIRVAAAAGRGSIRFSVSDDGPGIPAEVRGRIFEPGFTTKVGGWGVGLSLARRIIEELHDGRIASRPRRGGGVVFEIELPAEPGAGGRAAARRRSRRSVAGY
ncbi:MAG TPA: HAMP domain-containing sensor histidine kinase [Longimicrobiales bacterium]